MIVMKFGGTSVGTLLAINQVAAVVAVAMPSQPIVVTSAMSGVTDELIALAKAALTFKKEEWLPRIAALRARHEQAILGGEASGLETKKQIDTIFFELEQVIHPKTMQPAFAAGIPIFIKNTLRSQAPGTKIKKLPSVSIWGSH